MGHPLRSVALIIALVGCCFAAEPRKVTSDEAKQHLIGYTAPEYPPLAKAARIQGTVRIQVTIDERGEVTMPKVIRGHPMLVPSALSAIKQWSFRPFETNGKPAPVLADLEVEFPLGLPKEEIEREERFQETYWPAMRAAEKDLAARQFDDAEKHLLQARASAQTVADQHWLSLATTTSMLGNLRFEQGRYSEAESLYRDALKLHEAHQKPDESELAHAFSNLGVCLIIEGQIEEGESLVVKAVNILKQRSASTEIAESRLSYRRAVAFNSLYLARLAQGRGQFQEAKSRCKDVMDNVDAVPNPQSRKTLLDFCRSLH